MESEILAKKKNIIHPTAVINWEKVQLGQGNSIGPYACIGMDPMTYSQQSDGLIKIGDNNIIREFATIHLPTKDSKVTFIGDDNFLMCYSHISHDCKVENKITVAAGVVLNGHVNVMSGAYIGTGVAVHQYQTIGSYAIVGMNSTVTKKSEIFPGGKYIGSPAKRIGINQLALDKFNVSKELLEEELIRYRGMIHTY
tara:strand:- start:5144 stop:5734 length:591 start_codon:yes stop_codon:yes gene_type:complete